MWQVKKNGVVYAHGPQSTFPNAAERKALRAGGYRIYLDNKPYKEEQNA